MNVLIYLFLLNFKYLIKLLYYFYNTGIWYWNNYFLYDILKATLSVTIPISFLYLLLYFYGSDKGWTYNKENDVSCKKNK